VDIQKVKLTARVSLSKGGLILASVSLTHKKEKEVKIAGEALKKAKYTLARAESKVKDEVYYQGVANRKEERERKKWVKE
jgi:co-chaperonin GroES (HSP10)